MSTTPPLICKCTSLFPFFNIFFLIALLIYSISKYVRIFKGCFAFCMLDPCLNEYFYFKLFYLLKIDGTVWICSPIFSFDIFLQWDFLLILYVTPGKMKASLKRKYKESFYFYHILSWLFFFCLLFKIYSSS